MWYEILPSYIIITTVLSIPNLFVYFSNKLLLGQPFRRNVYLEDECQHYLRDARLSGRNWAYDFNGLENIPDLEKPEGEAPKPKESKESPKC